MISNLIKAWVLKIKKEAGKDTNRLSAEWTKLDQGFLSYIEDQFPALTRGDNKLYFDFLKTRLENSLSDKRYSFIYWIVGQKQKPENKKRPIDGVIDWLENTNLAPTLLSDVIRAEKRSVRQEAMAKFVRNEEDFNDKINFLNGKLELFNTPAIMYLLTTTLNVKIDSHKGHDFLTTENLLKIEDKVAPLLSVESFNTESFQKVYIDQYWLDKFRNQFNDHLRDLTPAIQSFGKFIDGYFNNMSHFRDIPIYIIASKFNLSEMEPEFGQIITSKLYSLAFEDLGSDEARLSFFHQKLIDGEFIEKQNLAEYRLDDDSQELSQLEEMIYSLVTRLFKASNSEAEKTSKMALSNCLHSLSKFRKPLGAGIVSLMFCDALIWKHEAIKSDTATAITPDSIFKKIEPILDLMQVPQEKKEKYYQEMKLRISPDYILFQRNLLEVNNHKDLLKLLSNLPKAFEKYPLTQMIKMQANVAENAAHIDRLIFLYKSDVVKIFKVFQDNIENAETLLWRNIGKNKDLFLECVKRITEQHKKMNLIKKDMKVA